MQTKESVSYTKSSVQSISMYHRISTIVEPCDKRPSCSLVRTYLLCLFVPVVFVCVFTSREMNFCAALLHSSTGLRLRLHCSTAVPLRCCGSGIDWLSAPSLQLSLAVRTAATSTCSVVASRIVKYVRILL